jgi:hypothetical protein
MIQVVLEICTGAASFRVTARARSILRAVRVAGARYPNGEVRLVLPVEPETFFVGGVPNEVDLARVPERLAG